MSTATADMLSIDRHTSLYGPPRTDSAPADPIDKIVADFHAGIARDYAWAIAKRYNRLDDIATFVRSLTYGEMMDLAAALWKMRPEGKEVTEQELPGMWHRWSTNRE